jgi:anti-anti-sigma factor
MTTPPRHRGPQPSFPPSSRPQASTPSADEDVRAGVFACAPGLMVGVEHDGSTSIVTLHGELDIAGAGRLGGHIAAVITEHDPHRLLLELSELAFTDSSGLAVMVWAHQVLDRRGRQLRLHHPQPRVLRLLNITGLHTRLHITEAPAGGASPSSRRRPFKR